YCTILIHFWFTALALSAIPESTRPFQRIFLINWLDLQEFEQSWRAFCLICIINVLNSETYCFMKMPLRYFNTGCHR
ncbi:hypothetical protein, partial [Xanthomonas oryzae]|uniref:hypothetical protein n=1 Tax=Xanthomonas oryzae TaxID=347 RepID=UPI001C4D2ADD